jgi:hypothetical protein
MPNPHSAAVDLASLLDGSSAGELVPEMVRNGLQQLIQLELAAFLVSSDRFWSRIASLKRLTACLRSGDRTPRRRTPCLKAHR